MFWRLSIVASLAVMGGTLSLVGVDAVPAIAQANETQPTATQLHQEGTTLYRQGNWSAALEKFEQALTLYQEQGDRTGEATVLLDMGELSAYQDEEEHQNQALELYQQSLAIAQDIDNRTLEARALVNIGRVSTNRSDGEDAAQDYFQQALAIAVANQDAVNHGQALLGLGLVAFAASNPAQTVRNYQHGLELFRSVNDRRNEAIALMYLGNFLFFRSLVQEYENNDEALTILQEALDIAQELEDVNLMIPILDTIASIHNAQGEESIARDYEQQRLAIARDSGNPSYISNAIWSMAWFYQGQKDYSQAIDYFDQAFEAAIAAGDRQMADRAIYAIGEMLLDDHESVLDYFQNKLPQYQATGDVESIVMSARSIYSGVHNSPARFDYLHNGLVIVQELGELPDLAEMYQAIALNYQFQQQDELVLENYQQALAIYQELDDQENVADVLSEMGRAIYLYQPDHDYFQQALAIYEELEDFEKMGELLLAIAMTYSEDREQAIKYYQQSITVYQSIDNQNAVADVMKSIASMCQEQQDYDCALDYYQQSVAVYQGIGDQESTANTFRLIGYVYQEIKEYKKAFKYHHQALNIYQDINQNERSIAILGGSIPV